MFTHPSPVVLLLFLLATYMRSLRTITSCEKIFEFNPISTIETSCGVHTAVVTHEVTSVIFTWSVNALSVVYRNDRSSAVLATEIVCTLLWPHPTALQTEPLY